MSNKFGELAALDALPDVGVPLIGNGGQFSPGLPAVNRLADVLTTNTPHQYDETVRYRTASPLINITEGDIGRATEAAMGVSGGGMSTKGIKAYHSSPHDFDRFDLSKIGTGEGAQVYGHGLYFAENPAVSGQGGQYYKAFEDRFLRENKNPVEGRAFDYLKNIGGYNRAEAIPFIDETIAERLKRGLDVKDPKTHQDILAARELLASGGKVGPRTYEVNIKADPAQMLDWDKVIAANDPLRQMVAGSARTAFDRATTGANRNIAKDALLAAEGEHLTGQGVYEQLARTNTRPGVFPEINIKQPARASEMLREAGIPGIKYLDQGSRNATPVLKTTPAGDIISSHYPPPTSNYVVFDPSIIDITKKYAVPGAIGAGAMGSLAAQDQY